MKRVFGASDAKGGCDPEPAKKAFVLIKFQNEFTTEGGKLHCASAHTYYIRSKRRRLIVFT